MRRPAVDVAGDDVGLDPVGLDPLRVLGVPDRVEERQQLGGEPALPEGFPSVRYANPDAPKGGRLVEGVLGSFDSLNPFIVKGLVAQGIRSPFITGSSGNVISGYVVESLMVRGYDAARTIS